MGGVAGRIHAFTLGWLAGWLELAGRARAAKERCLRCSRRWWHSSALHTIPPLPACTAPSPQVHGGPPVACGASLDEVRQLDRNREPPEDGPMCEMLWNDPQEQPGMTPNKVGQGGRARVCVCVCVCACVCVCVLGVWSRVVLGLGAWGAGAQVRGRELVGRGLATPHAYADAQTRSWLPCPHPATLQRGVGVAFGPDVAKRWLEGQGLQMVVRSHEVKEEGYEVAHDGYTVTIFSAPNYCDQMGNKGAFIRFDADCTPSFTQFGAAPHPDKKPMAYAAGAWASMM